MPARALVLLTSLALLLGACGGADPAPQPTSLDEAALRIDRLHREMADVATSQRAATRGLLPVLEAVRQLDAFVAGMRDPERIRTVEDTWPRVDGAFAAADPGGLREALVEVAIEVDTARVTLSRARDALPEPWEQRYLDAEDEVLKAVRTYAEATDALVQILQRHWPTYVAVHEASAGFVNANEFYRSSQEAVQAYEVRVGRLVGALAAAEAETATFQEAHAEAARAVNAASEAAAETWDDRPAERAVP